MSMKIQKGVVKYKDRSDIVCTYGVTDSGEQYFFLEDFDSKTFSNGNRIATSSLVEAVDPMVKPTHIGLISENGDVVIPFDNCSIRPINDELLVVEKAEPVSQNVIDAIELRKDSSAAAKLVSTSARIKDKLSAYAVVDGKYVFNDQFSEASVFDINGNNVIGDQYYSFICFANNTLYMSTNTIDSAVVEFKLGGAEKADEIDVQAAALPTQVVEDALAATEQVPVVDDPMDADIPAVDEVAVPQEPEGEKVQEYIKMPVVGDELVVVPKVEEQVATTDGATAVVSEETQGSVEETDSVLRNETVGEIAADEGANPVNNMDIDLPTAGFDSSVTSAQSENLNAGFELSGASVPETGYSGFSDDLKAFSGGIPSDEVVDVANEVKDEQGTTDAMVDIPAGLESGENNTQTEVSAVENVAEADTQAEVPADENVDEADTQAEVPVDENVAEADTQAEVPADEIVADADTQAEVPVDENVVDADTQSEVPVDEKVPDVEAQVDENATSAHDEMSDEVAPYTGSMPDSVVAEAEQEDLPHQDFSSDSLTKTNVNMDVIDNSFARTIDAQTVLAAVDKNNNGIIDSNEEINNVPSSAFTATYDQGVDYQAMADSYKLPTDVMSDSYFTTPLHDSIVTPRENIMGDVTDTLSSLIRQNRDQKGKIIQFQTLLEQSESQKRQLSDQFQAQVSVNEALTEKVRSFDGAFSRLQARNQVLETRVHEQDIALATKDEEIRNLRSQVASNTQDVKRLLADAREVLRTSEDTYSTSYGEDVYYKKAA